VEIRVKIWQSNPGGRLAVFGMRARWVLHDESAKLPTVGRTIVAAWLPTRYYLVSTIQIDPSSPLMRLTRSIETGERYEEVGRGPEVFVTQVFKCDKHGWVKDFDNPLHEREYPDMALAKVGHKETVDLLSEDRLGSAPRSTVYASSWRTAGIELTEPELRRWLWLRAIEWTNWPAFISQPLAPVLFVFFWWPYVVAGVITADVLWALVRYSYVSPRLASLGAIAGMWLKWPAAVGSAIYLLAHRSHVAAVLAVLWPLLAGLVCVPAQVGRVELILAKKIGYADQSARL